MKIGYSRVSPARQGQPFETQREALLDAGCDAQHLHSDTISGTNWSRPGLSDALEYMRPGGHPCRDASRPTRAQSARDSDHHC